jgi:hypothetical protein
MLHLIDEAIMSTMAEQTSYRGPERRRHRVLVTRNSEYHCRDGVCVAVRDRRTNQFLTHHAAVGRHISGGLRFNQNGGIESATMGSDPRLGDQICFAADEEERTLITSPLSAIERPPKDIVATYDTH